MLADLKRANLYTGYVPVMALIEWSAHDLPLYNECIDIRPMLDTFDQKTVDEWKDVEPGDDYNIIRDIIDACDENYLLKFSNPPLYP